MEPAGSKVIQSVKKVTNSCEIRLISVPGDAHVELFP